MSAIHITPIALALLLFGAASAEPQNQAPDQKPPAFEVASIKPNKSGDDRTYSSIQPGGRLSATNATVKDLILSAYRFQFQPSQIIGGPSWVTSDHFDIEAKPASGSDLTEAQIPAALRGLLAERFKLAVHEETRDYPIYVMVRAQSDRIGSRMKPSADGGCADSGAPPASGPRPAADPKGPQPCGRIIYRPDGWSARRVTTDQIAKALESFVGRVVQNRTDLTGPYNIDLEFTRDSGVVVSPDTVGADRATDSRTSIFTALREQLGLRLDAQKNSVSVLVIDRVEKPTPD